MRSRPMILAAALATPTVLCAPAASAHDSLTGAQPAAGSTVTAAPATLKLTFNEPVLELGTGISVTAPNGATKAATVTVAATSVEAPFVAAGNGVYTVTWRATSADGHPVSGSYRFTVAQGASSAATSVPSSSASSPSSSSVAGGALGQAGASTSPTSVTGPSTPTTNEPGDNEPLLVIGGAILAAVALAGAFFAARRRVHDDPR